ncbi:hypothetical protein BE20_25600 [Sorangium cellulosum]|uniref:SnoaL-like domain-containing protein n=1 Tax=Sorangium cellulosum TaxID=56 RepID=A0A150RPN2_SORCE|nr:hypothetical protein BE18_12025 [Sorangium cellulosum]KYF87582.1 hypothetical protein BE20_25600 [Sorangium cellulosum]
MESMVEAAVKTYIDAASERDPEKRAAMLEACFAPDGRVVSRSREIRGRAAVADEIAKLLADPLLVRVRMLSVIDAGNTTFRFRSVVERSNGENFEFFDAGEVDATGRISLVLTFAGPLREAADRLDLVGPWAASG